MDFLIFPIHQKTTQKMTKYSQIPNLEIHACQDMVAMVRASGQTHYHVQKHTPTTV